MHQYVGMPNIAQQERHALSDTLTQVGPDAPTLCGDWTTKELAAHLVLRERRPDAALGAVVPALAGHTESVQRGLASGDYTDLVGRIRQGPPRWHPAAISRIDVATNTGEFFVHHEDVLRAGETTTRRTPPADLVRGLWAGLPQVARLALRDVRVGVVADSPGHGRRTIRKPKDEHGSIVLTGAPGEVLLSLFNRDAVADVTIDGADADVAAYRSSSRGI